jgi:acetolactate synthase-1/2/3 large subunit
MADGYSRVSNGRRIGVLAIQDGPGIENMFGAVAQAFGDSIPILALPLGPQQHELDLPPQFDPLKSYQNTTKWAARMNFVDRVPDLMRRAYTLLRTGRGYPVLLQLPRDVAAAELPEDVFSYTPVRGSKPAGDPSAVAEAAQALLAAKRPLLHVGHGVLWAEAWDELRELAELVQVPVMTTMAGKSAFPEDHPLAVGMAANHMTDAAAHFLETCDLVFGVGCSLSKWKYSATIPPGKVMVHCTLDERDIGKDYPIDVSVIGDAKLVLQQLIDKVRQEIDPEGRSPEDSPAKEIQAIKEAWLETWMPKLTSDEVPINPYRVIWDLMHTVDRRKTIVTHESGNPRDQMAPFWETLVPRGYLGWGKSTQLGTSLGLAMGAKLAAPDKLVVNVMGDLAFGMAGMDVETAVRERIPIMTIVLNNGCLGGYGKAAMPIASELYGTNKISGHYAQVAKGLGAYSERVEQPEDVVPAIQRGIRTTQEGQPVLLEMITKEEPVFSN